MEEKPTFALLGVGNLIQGDDAIGIIACAYLAHNFTFTPPLEIIEADVLGMKLLDFFIRFEKLLILDTMLIDEAPGSLWHVPASALEGLGFAKTSAHEIGVLEALEMVQLLDAKLPQVEILGVVPEYVGLKMGLSPTLDAAFEFMIHRTLEVLALQGFHAQRNEVHYSKEVLFERLTTNSPLVMHD